MIGLGGDVEGEFDNGSDDERDGPLEIDLDQHDEDSYDESVCSACGACVSELTDKCPSCGEWIIHNWRGQPRTWVITVIVVILIVGLFWLTVG